jgi:ankyrin repeat protein
LVNLKGQNALLLTLERGSTNMVRMLLDKGVPVDSPLPDPVGSSPLHM